MKTSHPNVALVPSVPARAELHERSDDELMLLTRAGRHEAFDLLVLRYQARALRVAARYLSQPALAPDVAQRAFLELYAFRHRYEPRGKFWPFLSQLVLNQCRMTARSDRRHQGVEITDRHGAFAEDSELLARERQRALNEAVSLLSDKLREVVVLRYAADLSLEEIAELLSLPLGTIKSRLFAAMAKLRDILGSDS